MSCASAVPVLMFMVTGLLLGLMGWGILRAWRNTDLDAFMETRDDILMGLLALAAFALGAFLTFLLVGLH